MRRTSTTPCPIAFATHFDTNTRVRNDTLVDDDALSDHLEEYGKTLVDKEAFIFRKRLMSSDPMTLQEIGDEFTVSRERIRQVEKRLLNKLRTYLTAGMPEYFEEDEE